MTISLSRFKVYFSVPFKASSFVIDESFSGFDNQNL